MAGPRRVGSPGPPLPPAQEARPHPVPRHRRLEITTATAQIKPKRTLNATIVNIALNTITFIAFILAMQPHGTGIPVHEWGSVVLTLAIVAHLVLHWEWITGITRKLLGNKLLGKKPHLVPSQNKGMEAKEQFSARILGQTNGLSVLDEG